MAKNSTNTTAPASLSLRVGVIEMRGKERSHGEWRVYSDFIHEPPREDSLVWTCKTLAEKHTGYDFRYRFATLTFDDDGSKCVIY